jgi:ppGpp synthetase/RelA/SpoT-type nucleotidyltranferase
MNFQDYEREFYALYQVFSETVRLILEKALQANKFVPQSVQCRAKGADSLRRRLAEIQKLDTQTLELDRRDLAGARIIFYTNNDVDRFIASSLVYDNFHVEQDSTKFHHPTPENDDARYRAIHYTVQLREDRTRLPEYARFAGLRCEIQVQTILNHAWSETSHDVIYKKDKLETGYGENAMKGIARRFERIMDKYLIPAGFEIQKAEQEYDRLIQGKELVDKDIGKQLDSAQNNYERYQILSTLKDYAIPHFDDRRAAYDGLKGPLLAVVRSSRTMEPVQIETTYGKTDDFKTSMVTRLVIRIIEDLRYADAVGTLQLLIDIYRDEPDEDIRRQIVNAVKALSEYIIDVYRQVGPGLQIALVDHLASLTEADIDRFRPISLTVWHEVLQSDITGVRFTADTMSVSTGAVPTSDRLKEVRDKAIGALFAAYDRSSDDIQRRDVLSALDGATRTPSQGHYSNELLATTLNDATRIVKFVTQRAKSAGFGLLQHLEHGFLLDFRRASSIVRDEADRFNCQSEARALVTAILEFRDTINADDDYVRFKVLVGFESVYSGHWEDEEYDFEKADEHRRIEVERYIGGIDDANEENWFNLITLCAETKSDDLATLPPLGNFISKLAEHKPEVAERLLAKASDKLRNFLAGFLNGMALGGNDEIYQRTLENELSSAKYLEGIAHHLRHPVVSKPEFAARLLKRSIENDAPVAVIECLLLALEHYDTEKVVDADTFLRDALAFLNARVDTRWVSGAWFMRKPIKLYDELSPDRTAQLLTNLGFLPQVDYRVEPILAGLAKRQLEAVWDYFEDRLTKETTKGTDDQRFEAVPFRFHFQGLVKALSADPHLAIAKGLSWFSQDRRLFRFRGGRLLSIAFPECTPAFAAALAALVKDSENGDAEADFALAILENYEGEPSTHAVLKEIVSRFPDDVGKMNQVRISIDNAGVVSGDLGFVDAWRAKKEALAGWLDDERLALKEFAVKHRAELDLNIATEHRRAETEKEMRKRDFEDEDDDAPDDDGGGGTGTR